ncbi:MAG: hypothetical protein WCK88_04270 [bacterium]
MENNQSILAAAAADGPNGYIYTSIDYGKTWIVHESIGEGLYLLTLTSSINKGKTLLATGANGDYIFTSTDLGKTWITQTSSGKRNWWSLTSFPYGDNFGLAAIPGGFSTPSNIYISLDS